MKTKETIADFYLLHRQDYSNAGQFNVHRREEFAYVPTSLTTYRRNFYKTALVLDGQGVFSYADRVIDIKNTALVFTNPMIPYSWKPTTVNQTGYFCVFTENFVDPALKNQRLSQSPLFKIGGSHIFFPNEECIRVLKGVFENMLREIQYDYANKDDLLRTYVQIIMHEAMKMKPPETFYHPANASERISNLFLELLERQFPIDSPNQVMLLKNANEFATQLNVHTNTLNRSLREVTGTTTTELIAERIIKEAKALLQYSNWDIAEIAYCLGFKHSSNFHIFFKKRTSITPLQFRRKFASN